MMMRGGGRGGAGGPTDRQAAPRGLDAAAERGRADAAIAALGIAGGHSPSGSRAPSEPSEGERETDAHADDVRGDP